MNKCHCQNQYYYSCHHLKDSDVFSQENFVSMFVNDYNSLTIILKKKDNNDTNNYESDSITHYLSNRQLYYYFIRYSFLHLEILGSRKLF